MLKDLTTKLDDFRLIFGIFKFNKIRADDLASIFKLASENVFEVKEADFLPLFELHFFERTCDHLAGQLPLPVSLEIYQSHKIVLKLFQIIHTYMTVPVAVDTGEQLVTQSSDFLLGF